MQWHHSSLSLISRIGGNLAGSVLAKLIVCALLPGDLNFLDHLEGAQQKNF